MHGTLLLPLTRINYCFFLKYNLLEINFFKQNIDVATKEILARSQSPPSSSPSSTSSPGPSWSSSPSFPSPSASLDCALDFGRGANFPGDERCANITGTPQVWAGSVCFIHLDLSSAELTWLHRGLLFGPVIHAVTLVLFLCDTKPRWLWRKATPAKRCNKANTWRQSKADDSSTKATLAVITTRK